MLYQAHGSNWTWWVCSFDFYQERRKDVIYIACIHIGFRLQSTVLNIMLSIWNIKKKLKNIAMIIGDNTWIGLLLNDNIQCVYYS